MSEAVRPSLKVREAYGAAQTDARSRRPGHGFVRSVFLWALVALGLALALIVVTSAAGREVLPYQALLQYQHDKMAGDLPPTVFLGDSSLGNAIDVEVWERQTGTEAVNLALTGALGYAATYTMLQEAAADGARDVFIVHAADLMTRPVNGAASDAVRVADDGATHVVRWWKDNVNLHQLVASAKYVVRVLLRAAGLSERQPGTRITDDYVAQRAPFPPGKQYKPLRADAINPEKPYFLAKIAELCDGADLNCVYAHGPLAEPICTGSDAYFEAVNRMIRDSGLPLAAERPLCIPREQVGDASDHVAPAFKARFTEKYTALLRPYSRLANPRRGVRSGKVSAAASRPAARLQSRSTCRKTVSIISRHDGTSCAAMVSRG